MLYIHQTLHPCLKKENAFKGRNTDETNTKYWSSKCSAYTPNVLFPPYIQTTSTAKGNKLGNRYSSSNWRLRVTEKMLFSGDPVCKSRAESSMPFCHSSWSKFHSTYHIQDSQALHCQTPLLTEKFYSLHSDQCSVQV